MKALNLIILALAVTLFVACSKKKDGNSQAHQGQNPYGLTPNDIYSGGYNTGGNYPPGGNPGYQLPQGSCNGPGQMFSDLVSYCGWLARDGERVCNPMAVRQNFLQYCQSFSQRFNYCVPQVRTGCYYTSRGCSFGSTTIKYSDRRRERDSGSYQGDNDGGPIHVIPPVTVYPPSEGCHPNPGKDCKKKNPKKSELICKLPSDSNNTKNYVYSYEQYIVLAKSDCSSEQTVAAQPVYRNDVDTSVQQTSRTTTILPTTVVKGNVSNQVATNQVVTAKNISKECMNLEKLNDYIADPKSGIGSASEYYKVELTETTKSKAFVDSWKLALKPTLDKYPLSVASSGHISSLTAIGANIDQKESQLRMFENLGQIISCSDKHLTVKYYTVVGQTHRLNNATYSWNGLYGTDLEIIETVNGTFKKGNESSNYSTARYIGTAGKNLNTNQVESKVLADMKRKKFLN